VVRGGSSAGPPLAHFLLHTLLLSPTFCPFFFLIPSVLPTSFPDGFHNRFHICHCWREMGETRRSKGQRVLPLAGVGHTKKGKNVSLLTSLGVAATVDPTIASVSSPKQTRAFAMLSLILWNQGERPLGGLHWLNDYASFHENWSANSNVERYEQEQELPAWQSHKRTFSP
jgi:hypothetical protein